MDCSQLLKRLFDRLDTELYKRRQTKLSKNGTKYRLNGARRHSEPI